MATQQKLDLANATEGPIECLGMTFPNDKARRAHFLRLLEQKLNDPEFRKIEGFPIGKAEDILALSDPPYFTACPNPWVGDFVTRFAKPYEPKNLFHREPFAADVSEGKNHAIYNAHSYHTKVPHRAIMRYILHYTDPGEVLFDNFCGTGMSGLAGILCGDRDEVQALGYQVREDGVILDEEGKPFSKLGPRPSVLMDLSPAATFIAQNYNLPIDLEAFLAEGDRLLTQLKAECEWMYLASHRSAPADSPITYIIWSDIFGCPECGQEIVFWDAAVDEDKEEVRDDIRCSKCGATGLTKAKLVRLSESKFDPIRGKPHAVAKRRPVRVEYFHDSKRIARKPVQTDFELLERIESMVPSSYYPNIRIDKDIDLWYERDYKSLGVDNVYDFFTRRGLLVLAKFRQLVLQVQDPRLRTAFGWVLTSVVEGSSLMNRERPGGMPSKLSGTLYIGALIREINILSFIERKIKKAAAVLHSGAHVAIISTASAARPSDVPDNTIDYVFVDPPFGSNIIYSDLSILWEGWLGILTNTEQEAVVHRRKKAGAKLLGDYQALMLAAFRDIYRALKPGRWITVEFSNTQASVWNTIQVAIQEAGFVVGNVAALDKKQGSFKAVTTPTAVKQDLVISAYKPNGGLEERFAKSCTSVDGVWDFIRTHLRNLPVVKAKAGRLEFIAERDPRILYDRTVAFYVRHSILVPVSSTEFRAALVEKFPERDGMAFLPDQVSEYDKKRSQMENVGQMSIFVEDERSAIDWLRRFLKDRPSTHQDTQPEFMQQLSASWKRWETRPELRALLDQNFLCYTGSGDVPSQIHSYLSTQFKELRKLSKDDARLKSKAKDRWYVPDLKNAIQVEEVRNKHLLDEFWTYLPVGYKPQRSGDATQSLPGIEIIQTSKTGKKKFKEVRTEAIRVGFKHCFQIKDYQTILAVARQLPEGIIEEDEHLQMIYDMTEMRVGGA